MVTPQFHKTLVVGRGGNGTNILSVDWAKPFRRALGLLPSSFKDVTPAPLQHLFPDPGAGALGSRRTQVPKDGGVDG